MTRPVGILGGSFDPVHNAHIQLAQRCRRELDLQHIRLIPVGRPVHRRPLIANPSQRLAMLRLATAGHPELIVDDIELRRGGRSYTIDTLRQLKKTTGALCLIMGDDAFHALSKWKDWQELFHHAHIVVLTRRPRQSIALPAALDATLSQRLSIDKQLLHDKEAGLIYRLNIPAIDISATAIRQKLEQQATASTAQAMLSPSVFDYIQKHKLYPSYTDNHDRIT